MESFEEIEFGNVVFLAQGKTEEPGEKPLEATMRTNHKPNQVMTPSPGIEPGGECSHHCVIPAPPPPPKKKKKIYIYIYIYLSPIKYI